MADLSIREADIVREIERLKSSIASARANLKEQKAIRGELVVLARVQKDKGAQNSLYAIDKDSTRDNQDIADDEAALREMEVQLDAVRNAIFAAEWEARRAELRAVLVAPLEGKNSAKPGKAAQTLASELKAASEEDEQIALLLTNFEPNLRGSADELKKRASVRADIIGANLSNLLPIQLSSQFVRTMKGRDVDEVDRQSYALALEALDRLELVF